MTKLHFGGLPYSLRHEDLMQLLQPYAPVHHCELMYERETGRPRGFAFVTLDRDKAEEACKALDQQAVFGRMLQVTNAANQRHDNLNGGQPPAGPPHRGMPPPRGGMGRDYGPGPGAYNRDQQRMGVGQGRPP